MVTYCALQHCVMDSMGPSRCARNSPTLCWHWLCRSQSRSRPFLRHTIVCADDDDDELSAATTTGDDDDDCARFGRSTRCCCCCCCGALVSVAATNTEQRGAQQIGWLALAVAIGAAARGCLLPLSCSSGLTAAVVCRRGRCSRRAVCNLRYF